MRKNWVIPSNIHGNLNFLIKMTLLNITKYRKDCRVVYTFWSVVTYADISRFSEPLDNELFDYDGFFKSKIDAKKKDHSYRVFKKVR